MAELRLVAVIMSLLVTLMAAAWMWWMLGVRGERGGELDLVASTGRGLCVLEWAVPVAVFWAGIGGAVVAYVS